MNHLFGDSWVSFHLYSLYKPSFLTPQAPFVQFGFGEQETSVRVRVCVSFAKVERIMSEFEDFSSIEVCEVCEECETCQSKKLSLITPF